jgi:hypothetical protein
VRKAAQIFAGYLDNGVNNKSFQATKDVLMLPFAADVIGDACLLLLPYWMSKVGSDYQADLQLIQDAIDDGT